MSLEQAEAFAESWYRRSFGTLAIVEAFGDAGVLSWPDDSEGQGRYKDIEDTILARTWEVLRPAVAGAFVQAANDVLVERISDRGPA